MTWNSSVTEEYMRIDLMRTAPSAAESSENMIRENVTGWGGSIVFKVVLLIGADGDSGTAETDVVS